MRTNPASSDESSSLPRLDRRRGAQPLRIQLADRLREAIQAGALPGGARLPSTRRAAAELGVSRGVVTDAYAQLRSEGWLVVEATRCPRVRAFPCAVAHVSQARQPARYDLLPEHPDLLAFPRAAWLRSLRRVIRHVDAADLGYGDPEGPLRARKVLAAHLVRTRAAAVDAERLILTSGFTQGLSLLCRALARHGARSVAIEDPSPPYLSETIKRAGLRVVAVPVDAGGLNTSLVPGTGADAVLLTPAHQYPTGTRLPPDRRAELTSWAAASGAMVIEDDHDAELLERRTAAPSLTALAPDHVVLVGSTAKSLAPAMRIGWIAVPARWRHDVTAERWYSDSGAATLEALAFADFLERGELQRHVRALRRELRTRREALTRELEALAPRARVVAPVDALHLTITFGEGIDDRAVATRLAARRIRTRPLSAFRHQAQGPPGLVLGVAQVPPAAAANVVRQLNRAIGAAGQHESPR